MHTPLVSRHAICPACLWLVLVLFCTAPARASSVAPSACPAIVTAAPDVPFAAWYDKLWNRIYQQLNNRTGAIQFGFVGMLIALWIIWWRK